MAELRAITGYSDDRLRVASVGDWSNALNGLQLENSGRVTKIGAAVDACEAVIGQAAAQGVDLLVVHHGLFWAGTQPVVGPVYRKIKLALDHDMAIYSAHLPLDLHPTFGNNALLAKALGLKALKPFFFSKGQPIGLRARVNLERVELARRLEKVLGRAPHLCPGGPGKVVELGIVTGGAGGSGGRGYVHHRGRAASFLHAGRGARGEPFLRRPLRH